MQFTIEDPPSPNVTDFPRYNRACYFLRLVDGQFQRTLQSMRSQIWSNVGTPQETRDWSRPDEWIPQILSGDEQILANRLWINSGGVVNPRHIDGEWRLSTHYQLVDVASDDVIHLTERGQDFMSNPLGATVQDIDYREGLLHLLSITSEHGPGKRSNFLPPFTEFLERYSNYRSENMFKWAWYDRTRNLVLRGLVARSGFTYEITQAGLSYLEQVAPMLAMTSSGPGMTSQTDIWRLIKVQSDEVRVLLRQALESMDPYAVEFLVKRLLEALEYENVEVTRRSGDGGVDVVADIEVGITPVREVVQVKRHKGNIQRRVLDELRGSLHRFDAMRGTVITTGDFSRGAQEAAFERGAPPITLIDGERLIDLLIEHDIGVKKRTVQLLDFDPTDLQNIEESQSDRD